MLSCQTNKDYTIKGTVANSSYEGTNVYLQKVTDDAIESVDTAVVTNGTFSFEGLADTTVLRFVSLDESIDPQKQTRIPVLVEPGKIEVKFDSVITVAGTKTNNAYNDFRTKQTSLTKEVRSIVDQYNSAIAGGTMTDSLDAQINSAYDRISGEIDSLNFGFIKDNIKNELGQYLFMTSAAMFEPAKQKEILDLTDDAYKSKPNIQRIMNPSDMHPMSGPQPPRLLQRFLMQIKKMFFEKITFLGLVELVVFIIMVSMLVTYYYDFINELTLLT